MYAVVDGLLGKDSSSPVLLDLDTTTAANSLAEYFVNKIKSIRDNLVSPDPVVADTSFCVPFTGDPLSVFVPVTHDELSKVIASSKSTSSTVDPVPTQIATWTSCSPPSSPSSTPVWRLALFPPP
jgi:hypothetical protein